MSDARNLVEAQKNEIRRLQGQLSKRSKTMVLQALVQARAQLLRAEVGSWTAASRMATVQMLSQALKQMTKGVIDLTVLGLSDVTRASMRDVAVYLTTLDAKYLGAVRPLAFDSLQWWEGVNANLVGQVRLRQFSQSFQRYGAQAVVGIEDALSKNILLGETWDNARDQVWDEVRHVVGDKQWMVDRIIDTEVSAAYNGTQLRALQEEDEPQDPMLKKLVATFDSRTGYDSVMLHGQTRPAGVQFFDEVRGVHFDAPPNRPHDREIIVGWRTSWGDADVFTKQTRVWTGQGPPDPRIMGEEISPMQPVSELRSTDRPVGRSGRLADRSKRAALEEAITERQARQAVQTARQAIGMPHEPGAQAHALAATERLTRARRRRINVTSAITRAQLARRPAPPAPVSLALPVAPPAPLPIPVPRAMREGQQAGQFRPIKKKATNEAGWVTLKTKDGEEIDVLFKPLAGEKPNMREGTPVLHTRETAAYTLDVALGGRTIVPPTISRKAGRRGIGSAQMKMNAFDADSRTGVQILKGVPEITELKDARRIHLLDTIAGGSDRHARNAMVYAEAGEVRMVMVDNGYSFQTHSPGLVFQGRYAGRHVYTSLAVGPAELGALNHKLRTAFSVIDDEHWALLQKMDLRELARALAANGLERSAVRATLIRARALQLDRAIIQRQGQVGTGDEAIAEGIFREHSWSNPLRLIPGSDLRDIDQWLDEAYSSST